MTSIKHKRFKREKRPSGRIVLQDKDKEILKAVADYRFLDTRQLLALFPNDKSAQYLQRRLKQLYRHHYLDRPREQTGHTRENMPLIYALGKRGAEMLLQEFPELEGRVAWQEKNNDIGFRYIDHVMMINNFRITLARALNGRKESVTHWQQDDKTRDKVKIHGRTYPVAPDAFFIIEDGDEEIPFFFEADRSTMTTGRFFNKMQAYWQWYQERGHQSSFGIERFRVLTLTISHERRDNLRMITKDADTRGQGSEMFLFGCEKDYDFENPESILQSIWFSPKDNRPHQILE